MKYPLIEMTDWVFEGEKVFEKVFNDDEQSLHYIMENDIGKHYKRVLVDSEGYFVRVCSHKIIDERFSFKTWFGKGKSLVVLFNYERTKERITLEKLKGMILLKKHELFPITYYKVMTVDEFEDKVHLSKSYDELFRVATFEDD